MNDQVIIDELTKVLEPARALLNSQCGTTAALHTLAQPIIAALETHPKFKNAPARFFGQKQLMLAAYYQGVNLLQVAVERSASDALSWLHKIHSAEVADVTFVAEVYGLQVTGQHTLRNGVKLMPLEQLPPSANAQGIIAHTRTITLPAKVPIIPPIGAMLVASQVRVSSQFDAQSPHREELAKSVKAFTLMDNAAPVVGISWEDFSDPDLARAEIGQMWFAPTYEGRLQLVQPTEVNNVALVWVDQYLQLADDVKKVCDIAIERLNLARRRRSPGDKAIEGAICLEALLGDERSEELTYKLKLRSALLLETDIDQRKKIKKAVGSFYKLRSKTVHGRSKSVQDAEAIASEGLIICSRVLQAIVKRNEKPEPEDWELLGGAPIRPVAWKPD